ncbi:hypothetical protein RI543_005078 [Arxiozyma heterogenica]|uniref:Uncharacterized protein n=1 Tax=Arxiozyma heterogenica TaxID=278026 RepID=A0AAN8A6A8_9SACH|nr:hypothetical protein RI543_005078 [Kazachstania heterogenica]
MENSLYSTHGKRYLRQFPENYEKYSVPNNTKLFSRKQDRFKNNLHVLYAELGDKLPGMQWDYIE